MVKKSREYALKLYDTVLMRFRVDEDEYGRLGVTVKELDESKKRLLPMQLVLDADEKSILSWLEGRKIPKNRRYVDQILATAGLQPNDTLGIIDVCKGLSANDSYWLDDGSEDVSFDQINLFDNQLDREVRYFDSDRPGNAEHLHCLCATGA